MEHVTRGCLGLISIYSSEIFIYSSKQFIYSSKKFIYSSEHWGAPNSQRGPGTHQIYIYIYKRNSFAMLEQQIVSGCPAVPGFQTEEKDGQTTPAKAPENRRGSSSSFESFMLELD